jgi:hypothetical protein
VNGGSEWSTVRRATGPAVSCGLEFVVGDCHGQSLDGCGVLYRRAELHVNLWAAKGLYTEVLCYCAQSAVNRS